MANTTTLLPPPIAVKIAWALTGNFSKEQSKDIAAEAIKSLHDTIDEANKASDAEKNYVKNTADEIQGTMRTLDTIYKGRELNLTENDKLRNVTLDNIEKDAKFGQSAQDFIKSLPAMAFTTGAGTITLDQALKSFALPAWTTWMIGLVFAGLGYGANVLYTRRSLKKKQLLYIRQDYERDKYYEQYISRVKTALVHLYIDIDRLHKNYFGQKYPLADKEDANTVVEGILEGALPTVCEYAYEHLNEGLITPDMWAKCETGAKSTDDCKLWGK
jgi:hypothetical protein